MATIREMLDTKTRHELNNVAPKKKKKKAKAKIKKTKKVESLSTRDIKDLMGINRPTYKKVNGKIKQR